MKKIFTITMVFAMIFSINIFAQHSNNNKNQKNRGNIKVTTEVDNGTVHGSGFIDLDNDGYNDNAPDHDGDGIPNGLDPDYKKGTRTGRGFIDLDGDGINDNAGFGGRRRQIINNAVNSNKEALQNNIKTATELGVKNIQNFNNGVQLNGFGSGHFNGFGFGFSNKFGNNNSNGSGSGNSGSGNGDGTGNFVGPWNWGWGHGNNER